MYQGIADFFGLSLDSNLFTAIENSGVTEAEWVDDNINARKKLVSAINAQTDVMIAKEISKVPTEGMFLAALFNAQLSEQLRMAEKTVLHYNKG